MKQNKDEVIIVNSINVQRPIAEVFDYITTITNWEVILSARSEAQCCEDLNLCLSMTWEVSND